MTLDRAMAGQPFRLDLFRCHEAAQQLSLYKAAIVEEPWASEPKIDQFVFKTLFISICHQMNWDVMQSAMASLLFPNPYRRLSEFAQLPAKSIADALKNYGKQDRVKANERAKILRKTALELKQRLSTNADIEKVLSDPRLEGPKGFYEFIAQISAFTGDPFQKKARVLAHDLFREGIIPFSDPENLKPAVEYHLIRLYLRTGRVYTDDKDVLAILTGPPQKTRDRLVKLVREAVDEAMRYTALYSGLDAATLNYLEWQIGRSICIEELDDEKISRYCMGEKIEALPDDVAAIAEKGCPMRHSCRKLNDDNYPWLNEPQFQKAFY